MPKKKTPKIPRVYDENSGREPDGRWKRGASGNILGRPSGYQGLKDRIFWWSETKTVREVEELLDTPDDELDLCYLDSLVVKFLRNGRKGTNNDIELVFSRMFGKVPQAITGEDGKPLLPPIDVNEIARRAAFLLMSAASVSPLLLEQADDEKA